MKRVMLPASVAFIALALVACHSGGASSGIVPSGAPQSAQSAGIATFSMFVPSGSAAPASVSVTLLQSNGAAQHTAAYTANLSVATRGCANVSGGLSCTISVSAPPGSDAFEIATFSGANGTGAHIAISQTTVSVTGSAPKCGPSPIAAIQPKG